jgi:hypothetical protein
VSVAAALELDGDTIKEARLALGGVAHKPWRDPGGRSGAARPAAPNEAPSRSQAADLLLRDAKGFEHNAFKIDLARRAIVRALTQAAQGTPQSQSTRRSGERHDPYIGTATSRVDGRAKVTGAAKYAGEFNVPGLAYGSVVDSTIAKGRIARIDTSEALRVEGVLDVLTHENRPPHGRTDRPTRTMWRRKGSPFRPLYDDKIMFSGQPIALVLAEEWEIARFAASLVRVEYEKEAHVTDLHRARARDEAFDRRSPTSRAATPRRPCRRRGAPRGRIFHSDRASQPDGAVCLDGDLGRRRQAHGLRQDPGRAERAALSVQRVRLKPDDVRVMSPLSAARSARAASAISGGAGGAGGARAAALGARRADAPADVRARLPAGHHRARRARREADGTLDAITTRRSR